jgi:hypothetical protein
MIMSKKFCPHCHNEVIKSEIEGYSWQCLECEEDFYHFEVLEETEVKKVEEITEMKIVVCQPNNKAFNTTIPNTLEAKQKLVGGWIEAVYPWEDRVALVCKTGANEYKNGITKAQLSKIPYLMCDFTLSEAGIFIRSLFPKNHIFRLDVDNSSKLMPYLENGLGYSFLPYRLVKSKIEKGVLEEVPLKDFTAPKVTTYLLYKQGYDVSKFLENKFDEE